MVMGTKLLVLPAFFNATDKVTLVVMKISFIKEQLQALVQGE